MFYGGTFLGLVVLVLWIYCIFDVIATQESLIRNLPKFLWLIIVIILPTVGSIAWLVLGRPERAGFRPGDTTTRAPLRPLAPDDDPKFLARVDEDARRLKKWEEDLKRREDEMRRREEGDQGTT